MNTLTGHPVASGSPSAAAASELHLTYRLRSELDLQLALSQLPQTPLLADVGAVQRSLLCTITAELGSNMLKFARNGELLLRRHCDADEDVVEVLAEDLGPGISDVEAAVREHFSTVGTLGLGLPGVIRMADQVHIETGLHLGTSVRARKWLRGRAPGPLHSLTHSYRLNDRHNVLTMSWGEDNRPCLGQEVSGDGVAFRQTPSGQLVVVMLDASGHGPRAHGLAVRLLAMVHKHPDPEIVPLLEALHQACRGTFGAAAGVALIDPKARLLRYAGVGNTRARLLGPGTDLRAWLGVSRDGVLGDRFPTPFVQQVHLLEGQVLLLYSDGVSESLRSFRGSLPGSNDASALAHQVVSQCGRVTDDAACAAVRLA